ncbi:MAG: Mut7-C RNAse domain-containing protein, partial [Anaerolineales bacterium]
ELARISSQQQRTLLTRDRGLLKRSAVTHGYCVRATNPRDQMVEVVRRFDLVGKIAPFRRCMRCNGRLREVDKAAVLQRLLPLTQEYYEEFHECDVCAQVYWKGSHSARMQQLIEYARLQGRT